MDLGIAGKRVLVTGGSQGLGRAIAIDFATEGCRLAVVGRRADKLREIMDELGGEKNGHCFYAIDLMKDGAPTRAITELTARSEHFDIVVHNVGGTLDVQNVLSPTEEWYRVWRFNVGIAIEINGLAIPPMQAQYWGRIIHISSISAQFRSRYTPYAAAKAYLNRYVRGLGQAVAPDGIVVSALMPGAFVSEGGHWDTIRKTNPDMVEDFLSHYQAIGRLGTPEDISPFALFMASQHVKFATGAVIPIDGGTK